MAKSLRYLTINPEGIAKVSLTATKKSSSNHIAGLVSDAEELACSAVAFHGGIYPSESPYFFWGVGLWLPWAKPDRHGNWKFRPPSERDLQAIAAELKRAGRVDSDGRPNGPATYFSHGLCATPKTTIQSLAIEAILDIDDYLHHLFSGNPYKAIPWLSAAYAALFEATCQAWDLFGNAQARARAGGAERHRRDPKQADKNFVFECYKEWKSRPERYKSKAAFARDMLDKCEHLESQKKIEDWIRLWDRQSDETGTQRAR